MREKTKILAVGDIHGDRGLAKKIAKKADNENVDIVILAGDISWLENSLENMVGPFTKSGRDVILIPGNHEHFSTTKFLSELYEGTRDIHGGYFRKEDLGIFGAGNADAGPFSITEEELENLLNESHEKVKDSKKKILVTHMHPKGSKSEESGFPGSKSIKEAIEKFKPDIVIHGHVHELGGAYEKSGNTRIFNISKKPKIFEI